MSKGKQYRVGIFGHYGNKNLGDEAIIWSAIQNLRDRIPEIKLEGFSLKPQDTRERYNIDSFPIRNKLNSVDSNRVDSNNVGLGNGKPSSKGLLKRMKVMLSGVVQKFPALGGFLYLLKNMRGEIKFLRKARGRLKDLDAIIVCGSNQLLDNFGGPWGFPYTLYKWTLLAKSTDTKIFFVSVGAGPLSNSLSYWMLKQTLSRADYLSYRDYGSMKLIEDRVTGLKSSVYPDLAHSLKMLPKNGKEESARKKVAINPMPVFDKRYWYKSDSQKYNAYVAKLTQFVNYLTDHGYVVSLFNNHPKDSLVINDLLKRLQDSAGTKLNNVEVIDNKTVQDLINTISEADIIVATRFHSTVLPLRLGKPVLGICYHRKSKELLEDLGLGAYYVDISEFTLEELCRKFDFIAGNIDDAKKELKTHYWRYSELLNEQWNRLADLIRT